MLTFPKGIQLSLMCLLMGMLGLVSSSQSVVGQDVSWPQFRGPVANPTSDNARLPEKWSTTENVEWSVEVPGRGWSSPIVTDGKVFVTSVSTDGESKSPQVGTNYSNEYVAELTKQGLSQEEVMKRVNERDFELPDEVTLHYWVYCFDINDGKLLWKHEFNSGHPPGGRHRKNSFASETPVTDGQHVYIYITNLGLYAYDLAGNQVWSKKLDAYPVYLEFGTGGSPVLVDNQLIIVNDNEEKSFIASFDKSNGEQIWRTDREPMETSRPGSPKSGWGTPYVWNYQLDGKPYTEIVTMSPGVAISYDLQGKEIWRMTGMTPAPASSSFEYQGLLYLDAGKTKPMYAVRPGARGDISPSNKEAAEKYIVWSRPRAGTYIPSPVAYQGGLYILQDNGIFARLDTDSGAESFKARIKDSGADFTTSPWAYNGKVFCLSEQGDTYVLEAGEEFKLLHVNSLEDMTMSSPAIVEDRLLIRTEKRLMSIRNPG